MKKRLPILLLSLLVLAVWSNLSFSQDSFNRIAQIEVPQIENCGFGNVVAGVDFDEDGKKEIYAVNNMLDQGGAELIPRIYKFEYNEGSWDSVWSATMSTIPQQNSWPALTHGDWDQDGKHEIIWGPVNNLGSNNPNPPRILVFEENGDGSDEMGVFNFGNFSPNAQWTITDEDNYELRPVKWELADIDEDGQEELLFADRRENYRFGIVSVSDIPDDGGGTEEWTLEYSGADLDMDAATIYDMEVIGNKFYLFHSNGTISMVEYDGGYELAGEYTEMMPGGSWQSASAADVDGDGTTEMMVGGWSTGNNNIYLIREDSFAGILVSKVANLSSLIASTGRFNGGDWGDIDADGKMDFVFGTRSAEPNAAIVRVEYQGGGDKTDSANYTYSIIDSGLEQATGVNRFDEIEIANLDDDEYLEVVYSDNNQTGRIPIVILDLDKPSDVDNESALPKEYSLKQNYPNPFNPSTNIEFSMKESGFVNISVYNLLGEKVADLLNGEMAPGNHQVEFKAEGLSSGIYIYKLRTGNFEASRKMMLLR
jgi:hypothetical protein